MKTRKLGHSDIEVSAIGLGTMGMSEFYGQTNEEESIKTIHTALDNGVNFFDTSDMYGIGHNETLLGKAIKDRRDEAVIATKFGVLRNAETRGFAGVSGKPEYVKQSCEGSLKRLGIDTIDLYYQHRIDLEVPVEETIGAMAELVKEGKVRCLVILKHQRILSEERIRFTRSARFSRSTLSGPGRSKMTSCQPPGSLEFHLWRTVLLAEDSLRENIKR